MPITIPITINLKDVDKNISKQLIQFFDDQAKLGIKLWKKDTVYTLKDGTEFTLKNDMFRRERKGWHSGVRYELISNKKPIGKGHFATVRMIKGTVALKNEMIHFKKQKKDGSRRVVKIQNHSDDSNPLSALQKEYELSKKASHLAIKKPTVIDSSETIESYTVMNQIPGRELLKIINENTLSTQERIELSLALLYALKEQVINKGIIHKDIKPENILVKLGSPIVVNIIDFGFAVNAHAPNDKISGTCGFFAPELKGNPKKINYKYDVFSMARVISMLWGVDADTFDNQKLYIHSTPMQMIKHIFHDIKDLDPKSMERIKNTLLGMLEKNPKKRYSIDKAIEGFSDEEHQNKHKLSIASLFSCTLS